MVVHMYYRDGDRVDVVGRTHLRSVALTVARHRACAESGVPESDSSVARSSRAVALTMSGIVTMDRSGANSTPCGGIESHAEVLDGLRNEPLDTELREEFREQLVPPMELRRNV